MNTTLQFIAVGMVFYVLGYFAGEDKESNLAKLAGVILFADVVFALGRYFA